jgi:hypothetical protein
MFKELPNTLFTFSVKYGYNLQNSLDMLTHSNYKARSGSCFVFLMLFIN